VAKGASILERHVGLPAADIALNAYSSTPMQIDAWIAAWKHARTLCGAVDRHYDDEETASLDSLRRGVYARVPLVQGELIMPEQVFFAMPFVAGQLDSGRWKESIVAAVDMAADAPLLLEHLRVPAEPEHMILKTAIHEVKALLNEARIALSSEFQVQYSHHYGIRRFRETGVVIITCINREYCKKVLVQLPGQVHPLHYHKLKEETFQVLHGTLEISVDGRSRVLRPGDTCLVLPGVWHSFRTTTGCVLEEVSTTHYLNDTVYQDAAINGMALAERKTVVDHWGRFQVQRLVGEGP
jgi:N-acetylneuraminate synthase